MKLQTDAFRWSADEGGGWLCFRCQRPQEILSKVEQGKAYDVEIKKHRKRRSLDANAMAWSIIGQIAGKLRISPREVYRQAIQEIGENYEIVPVREDALEKWMSIWESHGIGWVCKELGPSKLPGYVNVLNYYGSSTYDTSQMSRLIDTLIFEAKEQGIDCMSDLEKARLMDEWGK